MKRPDWDSKKLPAIEKRQCSSFKTLVVFFIRKEADALERENFLFSIFIILNAMLSLCKH